MMEERGLRIIIADQNVQERESKEKSFLSQGMKVVCSTGDGNKALEEIRKKKPDVVVMDMMLPGIDGIGILEEIQREPMMRKKPIFVIQTLLKRDNLVNEAIEAGADYYMLKPISNAMLIKRILQLVEKRNGESELVSSLHQKTKEKESPEENQGCTNEYTFSGDLEMDITNILLEIGIPAHIKGYQYIREGILMAFYDRNMLHYITKFLYPTIAQKYKTTSSSVERTIRHAIEIAWRRGDMAVLEKIFGNTISAGKGKPTNSEFMALLTDRLRLEYRTSQVS